MTAKVGNNTNKWEGKYRHIGDLDQELRLFFFLIFFIHLQMFTDNNWMKLLVWNSKFHSKIEILCIWPRFEVMLTEGLFEYFAQA